MHARTRAVHQDLNPPGRDDYRHYDYNDDNNNIVHFCNSERVAVHHEMDILATTYYFEPNETGFRIDDCIRCVRNNRSIRV